MSRFSRDQAQELLTVRAVFLGKVPVAEWLKVLDDETRLLNGATKNIGIEKIDECEAIGPASPGWRRGVGRTCRATDRPAFFRR